MKTFMIVAACVIGLGIGWELVARAASKTDDSAQPLILAVLISKTCPDVPEAFSKARAELIRHALTKPYLMSPWQVARILSMEVDLADFAENPFPTATCRLYVTS